jgi:hypothetical protein
MMVGLSSALLMSMVACGGSATDSGDGDGDRTGDGDLTGDGDGDIVGDGDVGDGDVGDGDVGDGDVGDGDGVVCTDLYAYGLNVTVVGGANDPGVSNLILPPDDGDLVPVALCYATVVATDGDYKETLSCYSNDGVNCQCQGAGERPGSYTVTATLGDMVEEQEVVVTADECHVMPESLTFFAVK